MGSLNIYQDILPTLNMYSGLKPCYNKNNQSSDDINSEIETIQKQINYDINHLNDGLIKGNDSNLLIVFYVQIMPDDFVMQLHRF
ncbi:hypothetical protein G872_04334 [Escherichia coli HVH 221 (4-3136817)]|nr:hypothetical protein G872_04334 [Escherichia coli HVH 221 (4-3136817)]